MAGLLSAVAQGPDHARKTPLSPRKFHRKCDKAHINFRKRVCLSIQFPFNQVLTTGGGHGAVSI